MSLCWHIYELTQRGLWITGSITDTQLEIAADAVMEKAAKMREYVKYASIIDSPNFMESFFSAVKATPLVYKEKRLHDEDLPINYHLLAWITFPKRHSKLYPMGRINDTRWMSMCLESIASNYKKKWMISYYTLAIKVLTKQDTQMSYTECVETLSSMPTCTHCEHLQSARPSFHRWIRITERLSLNHRLLGIDALTPR